MVCHGCGERLPAFGRYCFHCGRTRGGARRTRALRARGSYGPVLWLPLTLLLGLHLYCWQQASTWRRASLSVRPLPAPQPPGGLVYQSDARLDPSDRGSTDSSPDPVRSGSTAGLTPAPRASGGGRTDDTCISVAVVPSDVTTYVYLNGGSLLGRAPLHDLPVRPGQHRLILWAPSIRGRAVRTVNVAPGEHAVVMTALAAMPVGSTTMVR
jgi:hypothetical protein